MGYAGTGMGALSATILVPGFMICTSMLQRPFLLAWACCKIEQLNWKSGLKAWPQRLEDRRIGSNIVRIFCSLDRTRHLQSHLKAPGVRPI